VSEKALWALYCKYKPSLRNLFIFSNKPDEYDLLVYREVVKLSVQGLVRLLRDADNSTDGTQYLISTEPSPTNRAIPERTVVSSTGRKPRITVSKDYLTDEFLDGRSPEVAFPVYYLHIDDDPLS